MKYKHLNEVLLDWNYDKDVQDNSIIKSSDIKKKIDKCFIYRVEDKPSRIKIFDDGSYNGWVEFKKYKDKVYINNENIELTNKGTTVKYYKPGEYRVYIKDIDQIKDTGCMFFDCPQLIKAYIPNTVTSIGERAFYSCNRLTSITIPNSVIKIDMNAFDSCRNIQTVYVEDINKFKQIDFGNELSNPLYYGAKLIELKK